MPHFEIRYSRNLEARLDMHGLCRAIAKAMAEIDIFETGGIRVRAIACDHAVIADDHQDNAFLDMVLRIGAGRSQQAKKEAGDRLFQLAENWTSSLLQSPHFALSLEIREIDSALSWKKNSIHPRLRAGKAGH